MNSLRVKQTVAAIWLALLLTFGGSIVGEQLGVEIVPAAYACVGGGAGGGC